MIIFKSYRTLFVWLTVISLVWLSYACVYEGQKQGEIIFPWLMGTWQDESGNFEVWHADNKGTMYGNGYQIKEQDTILWEEMNMMQTDSNGLVLSITVKAQNEGEKTPFAVTEIMDSGFVVQNRGHDFPSKIKYQRHTKDRFNGGTQWIYPPGRGKNTALEFH